MAKLWRALLGRETITRYSVDEYARDLSFAFNGNRYTVLGGSTGWTKTEDIEAAFTGYVNSLYKSNGVVFAIILARMLLFTEARFCWWDIADDGEDGRAAGRDGLGVLERPWPNAGTAELLARMEQDVSLGGNFYAAREESRLRRLRPDWLTIVLSAPPAEAVESDVAGYWYHPGRTYSNTGEPSPADTVYLPDEICHWSPIPDPDAQYRGMSWLTPVVREIMADKAATEHKLNFFNNGASLGAIIAAKENLTPEQFTQWMANFNSQHQGVANAYRPLFFASPVDVTVRGADMKQLDFKVTQGAGETRLCAAGGVPPIIVGLSEGLASATYSNYSMARRKFGDHWAMPQWKSAATALSNVVEAPGDDLRLGVNTAGIAFLREDAKDQAEIRQIEASTINSLITAGYEPKSAEDAVIRGDWTALKHTGAFSVQLQPPGVGMEEQEDFDFGALRSDEPADVERAYKPLRIDKGNKGGGRFRGLSTIVTPLLKDWAEGRGSDDPLGDEDFSESQLRSILRDRRKEALAAGDSERAARLTPSRAKPGDSDQRRRDRLKMLLYKDARGTKPASQDTKDLDEQYTSALDSGDRDAAIKARVEEYTRRTGAEPTESKREEIEQIVDNDLKQAKREKPSAEPKPKTRGAKAPNQDVFAPAAEKVYDDALDAGDYKGAIAAAVGVHTLRTGKPPTAEQMEQLESNVSAILAREGRRDAPTTRVEATEFEVEYERHLQVNNRWGMLQARVDAYRDEHGVSPDPEEYAQMQREVERDLRRRERRDTQGVQFTPAALRADLWEFDPDEISRAVEDAYGWLDVDDEVWRARYDLRISAGHEGGGRFRKLSDHMVALLSAWARGEGDDDPLDEFTRDQLRKVAVELSKAAENDGDHDRARALAPRRGASSDEIKLALYKDVRAEVRQGRDAPKPQAKFTLQSDSFRDLDVAVYKDRQGRPHLFRENDSGKRGGLVGRFDDLESLQAWAEANDEPRLAEWARGERDGADADPSKAPDVATPVKAGGKEVRVPRTAKPAPAAEKAPRKLTPAEKAADAVAEGKLDPDTAARLLAGESAVSIVDSRTPEGKRERLAKATKAPDTERDTQPLFDESVLAPREAEVQSTADRLKRLRSQKAVVAELDEAGLTRRELDAVGERLGVDMSGSGEDHESKARHLAAGLAAARAAKRTPRKAATPKAPTPATVMADIEAATSRKDAHALIEPLSVRELDDLANTKGWVLPGRTKQQKRDELVDLAVGGRLDGAAMSAAFKGADPFSPAKAPTPDVPDAAPDLTGSRGLSSDPATRAVQVENRIRQAYRDASRLPRDHVTLADLRERSGVDRAEFDATMIRLSTEGGQFSTVHLAPEEDRRRVTPRLRDAAIRHGGDDMHTVSFEDPSPRPLPSTPDPDGLDDMPEHRLRSWAQEFEVPGHRTKTPAQLKAELRKRGIGGPEVEQAKRRAEIEAEQAGAMRNPWNGPPHTDPYADWWREYEAKLGPLVPWTAEDVDPAYRPAPDDAVFDAPDSEVRQAIEDAWYDITSGQSGRWAKLADLRTRIGAKYPFAQVNRVLLHISRERGGNVIGELNQKTLTPRDRDARVNIGNQPAHLLMFDQEQAKRIRERRTAGPSTPAPAPDLSSVNASTRVHTSAILGDGSLTIRQKRARLKALGYSQEQIDELAPTAAMRRVRRADLGEDLDDEADGDEPEADGGLDDEDEADEDDGELEGFDVDSVDWGDHEAERADLDTEDDELVRAMDGNQLKHYWTRGKGLAKWANRPHGRWTALYRHLRKYVGSERAKRMAADWFHEVFGYWPGHQKGSNPVGPG